VRMLQPYGINIWLKGALKPSVFTPKAKTLKNPLGTDLSDSGPTPKKNFACRHCS